MASNTILLKDVARLLSWKPTSRTLRRWITDGLIGKDGSRVVLKSRLEGKYRVVEPVDVQAFMDAINK